MKVSVKFFWSFLIFFTFFSLTGFKVYSPTSGVSFPWKKAGLTERQAAAHLLSRFTFGAKPGDIDKVVKMGLENWFNQQLEGNLPDDEVTNRLKDYDALKLSNTEVAALFPRNPQVIKMAEADGVIVKDTLTKANKEEYKALVKDYMDKKRLRRPQELQRQFFNQKVIRAAYSNNQLNEVLTDFWFNHFNVSITKNDCAEFIPAYERDVIRKNLTGRFEDLVLATAKSPAMLFYLDNFSSSGGNSNNNPRKEKLAKLIANGLNDSNDSAKVAALQKFKKRKANQGLNENYAREVMELHTLGVDGGYTQQDVTNAAKVLTGWTIYPFMEYGAGRQIKNVIERIGEDKLAENGFVHEGDFLFAANRHDNSEKTVLGKKFNSANGYEEGVQLLKMLANHPSAASFISKKLAVRFVSDNPPKSLVDKMAATFLKKNGSIREVLLTMVSSPEFWSSTIIRQKTKSPFELVISAVRSLNADIQKPFTVYNVVSKMGQKMYAYQAPTGFPDKAQYWINTGALLYRMNFGLSIATQKGQGVKTDLLALNNGHEPESAEAALKTYCKILLPERDLNETIKRLTPLLNDPELDKKVNEAANNATPPASMIDDSKKMAETEMSVSKDADNSKENTLAINAAAKEKNMLSQVVGIIIGSPEFQRR